MNDLKYKPEPEIEVVEHGEEKVYLPHGKTHTISPGTERKTKGWRVEYEEDGGGYIFDDQDDAMMFCVLLEIRDLLNR